jgi:hypothetical protein
MDDLQTATEPTTPTPPPAPAANVVLQPLAVVELKHSLDTKSVVNGVLMILAAMFGLKVVLMLLSYLLKK